MKKKNKKMLITGVSGLLGNNLAHYFKDKYQVIGWYNQHRVFIDGIVAQKVDLLSEGELEMLMAECDPDVIIHCASLTNVDYCEKHPGFTRLVNRDGTRYLVSACKNPRIKLVYISTDSVYDGKEGNFKETDPVRPLNFYAASKYEGEQAVAEKENSVILRTNIFGWNVLEKQSLGEWILYELLMQHPIQGFKNAYFSSIYTFELARLLEQILNHDLTGIYNSASRTSMSKYEFACRLAQSFGLDKNLVQPIAIDDFPFVAKRGKNLSLNVDKLSLALGTKILSLEECIDQFYRDYQKGMVARIKNGQLHASYYPSGSTISYGRQSIDEDDIAAVAKVLKSSHLTQGERVNEFEQALGDYTGARYAVVFNSGTSALHAACLTAEVKRGDEVITSTNTFVASANCAAYCGAKPVLADIDSRTYNIDPLDIEKRFTPQTKAVIPVHFAGQSCDMEPISEIIKSKEKEYGHKICVIEDSSHALGSTYRGSKVGSGKYSDMTVMSFHPVKHITTGEGGVVFTNDQELYRRIKLFRSHGITNVAEEFINIEQAIDSSGEINPWYYEQQFLGYNYRLTDIQCALGISQLRKLPIFKRCRREIVDAYNKAFAEHPFIQIPYENPECESNWHLYVLCVDFAKIGIERSVCMRNLAAEGIRTQVHYIPVHLQPYYQNAFGYKKGDYPMAEAYYAQAISLPLYPALEPKDMERVITSFSRVLNREAVVK